MGPVDTLVSSVCKVTGLGGATGADLACELAGAGWLASAVVVLVAGTVKVTGVSVFFREIAGTETSDFLAADSLILGGNFTAPNAPEVSSSSELMKVEQAVMHKQTTSRPID
jgi:hypothetical protein